MKEFGEGVDRIYNEMAELGLPEPEYSIDAFMTKVVIRNNVTSESLHNDTLNDTLNDTERKIITEILKDNKVTADIISLNTGLAISTVKRYLVAMQKKTLITRAGSKRTGHWEVKRK